MNRINSPINRAFVSLIITLCIIVQAVRLWLMFARPVHIVPFIVTLQMMLFAYFVYDPDLLFYLAGNVAIVAASLLPITLSRSRYHWVNRMDLLEQKSATREDGAFFTGDDYS